MRVKPVWQFYPAANRPLSAVPSSHRQAVLPPGRNAQAKPVRSFNRSASRQASAARSWRRPAIEHRPIFGVGLMAARAETT
jgi:hypothetical protein